MSGQKTVLKTGSSLATFLDGVIQESVKSALVQKALQEKEKQAQASGGAQGGTDNSGDGDGDASSKTMDDETEKLQQGDVEPRDIVDKLNAIRSGKSFKDDQVKLAMEEYVGSLTKAEKVALLAFMKGIAQIVTGEIPGQQAVDPSASPAGVEMEKGQKQKTKHIEPNVIKAAAPKEKPKGGEDTSGPVPITPKRK
jgi:hypothetical protein